MLLYGGIRALAVLQVIRIGWSPPVLRRWWQQPARRPHAGRQVPLWRLGVPLALHLLVAYLFLVALPQLNSASIGFVVMADPIWAMWPQQAVDLRLAGASCAR